MKKLISIAIAFLIFASLTVIVSADDGITAYVKITTPELVLPFMPVTVTDEDGDGTVTINDALIAAHAEYYDGIDGFDSEKTDYGVSLLRLWGIENGGAYGYYLNDSSAWSLLDPITDGDFVSAFVYSDTAAYSDAFMYFTEKRLECAAGEQITLTLMSSGFDENWATVSMPVSGAVITVDGAVTDIVTDENGVCVLTLDAGDHIISADAEYDFVAPAASVSVTESAPATGDCIFALAAAAVISLAGVISIKKCREK